MARPKLNIIPGGAGPMGPMAVGIPAGGPRQKPANLEAVRAKRTERRSKKSYTGTVAGLGRTGPSGVRIGSGPKGPGQHAFHAQGVQLPARQRGTAAAVKFRPNNLMNRIAGALRKRMQRTFGP